MEQSKISYLLENYVIYKDDKDNELAAYVLVHLSDNEVLLKDSNSKLVRVLLSRVVRVIDHSVYKAYKAKSTKYVLKSIVKDGYRFISEQYNLQDLKMLTFHKLLNRDIDEQSNLVIFKSEPEKSTLIEFYRQGQWHKYNETNENFTDILEAFK